MSALFAAAVRCSSCGQPVCPRERLLCRVLGYHRAATCLPCLAQELGQSQGALCRRLVSHIQARRCLLREWNAVRHCRREGSKACCPSNLGG
ncbi:MAG: hypothetical protein K6T75_11405 [Acetobacteraceae bacterium]|nr:hypothetical protein [Acetobacteraceae bacterium]